MELDGEGDDTQSSEEKKEEKSAITSVGLKENIKNANQKSAAADDEVTVEDPPEDVKDEGQEGKKAGDANESSTKLGESQLGQDETADATVDPGPKRDYSLLDSICQFLYEDDEPLPILCGYFLKIMEQLLDKQKHMTLEYLLIHHEGKIFDGLLQHLGQHSLATLLIKLIEQQIQPDKKDKWDASDNSDIEMNEDPPEPELTADQKKMQAVLKQKSDMVVSRLIDMVSHKN